VRPAPAGGADDPPLSVAALWRETIATGQRNLDMVAIVAAAFFFLPQLAAALLEPALGATRERPSLVLLLGVALSGLVGQGAITRIALDDLLGRPGTVGVAIGLAARRLPQLFASNLVAGVAIGVGLIALVVPGVWLLGRFGPVTPVVMGETRDLVGSLERSWALTRAHAWASAVYLLLLFVLLLSLLFTGSLVAAALAAVSTIAGARGLGEFATSAAISAATAGGVAFVHVAQAVLYRQLLAEADRKR
jgi:hypothetical protein